MRTPITVLAALTLMCGAAFAGEIHDAARSGDVARIDQLLKQGVDVNEASSFGTALHFAAMRGHLSAVRVLLNGGADINAVSQALGSPLHVAVRENHAEVAGVLIDAGADLDARDKNEFTPLHFAALEGNAHIARALLDAGADAKAIAVGPGTGLYESGLFEPLQLSEKHGHPEVSELLRAAGGGPRPVQQVGEIIASADPERGRELANTRCIKCHVVESDSPSAASSNFSGPPIVGIFGQPVASNKDWAYSPALSGFGGEWTEDRLYAWILHPMLTVPGVLMPEVKSIRPDDVADIVAYLKAATN